VAYLAEENVWHENIYQVGEEDDIEGGPGGTANRQVKELADRSQYLKQYAEEVAEARGEAPTLSARLGELEELIEEGSGGDVYEFYGSFAGLPNPGVNGVKCVTTDTGFTYIWEDTQYTSRFASIANFPVAGIIGVIYIAKNTGLRYSWTGTEYAITFPTFGDFPLEGQAGVRYHAEDTDLDYTWHTDRYGVHYPTYADFPVPGESGIYYIADDTGFMCSWEGNGYGGTFATYADLPAAGIAGVLYYVTADGLAYGWYTNRYEAHFATVDALPSIGIAGRYYVTDTDNQIYTWNVSSQMYTAAYAAYAALPAAGRTTVLYVVTADNLTYTWNGTAERYETRFPNFAALPETGIAGRNYVTNDTGRLYTWYTDKYGAHYANFSAFPATGTEDRYWIDDSTGYKYEWWSSESAYAVHFANPAAFPNPGITGVIYVDDSTGQSYTYDGGEYAPTEGGNGVLGNGDNTTIEEVSLLTVLGVSTVAEAVEELHLRLNNEGSGNAYLGGLKLGMYLDLPSLNDGSTTLTHNATYQNLRIVIAGFNVYKNAQNTKNHIKFAFKNIPIEKQMRTDNTNDGGYPKTGGTTVLKPYLEGGFLTGLKAALGHDYLYRVKRKVTQGSNGAWTKTDFEAEIFLDTEKEVFGTNTYGDATTEADLTQTPLYAQGGTTWRIKKYNGSAAIWWEGSPYSSSTNYFCRVSADGSANINMLATAVAAPPLSVNLDSRPLVGRCTAMLGWWKRRGAPPLPPRSGAIKNCFFRVFEG
jgi:hypothetical protein